MAGMTIAKDRGCPRGMRGRVLRDDQTPSYPAPWAASPYRSVRLAEAEITSRIYRRISGGQRVVAKRGGDVTRDGVVERPLAGTTERPQRSRPVVQATPDGRPRPVHTPPKRQTAAHTIAAPALVQPDRGRTRTPGQGARRC